MKKMMYAALISATCLIALWGCRKKAGTESRAPRPQTPAEATWPGDKIDLKVFYAGNKDTDRAKGFAEFLGEHFAQVGRGDFAGFRPEDAADYDVVILDYDGLDLDAPIPDLTQDYARPTVTMGVPGAMLCRRLRLKTGYL